MHRRALYPAHGGGWNDYVRNDGTSVLTASDTACDATADSLTESGCIHGGEHRVVEVTGQSACAGLSATDSAEAFHWECDATTNPVRFISTRFQDGKGLTDLIDWTTTPPSWKAMVVRVMSGPTEVLATSAEQWWGNPIIEQNNGGTLAETGAVYVVTQAPSLRYQVSAPNVALVVKPGVTVTMGGSQPTVEVTGPDFVWVEGALTASAGGDVIRLRNAAFSVVRRVTADVAVATAIRLEDSPHARLSQLEISVATDASGINANNTSRHLHVHDAHIQGPGYGVVIYGQGSTLARIRTATSRAGVQVFHVATDPPATTRVQDIQANGVGGGICINLDAQNGAVHAWGVQAMHCDQGMELHGAGGRLTVWNVVAANNAQEGLLIRGNNMAVANVVLAGNRSGLVLPGDHSVVSNVTAANTTHLIDTHGLRLDGSSHNILQNALSVNAKNHGLSIQPVSGTPGPSSNNVFNNLAAAHNGQYGIYLASTSNNTFTGELRVGANPQRDCFVNGGTNPGMTAPTNVGVHNCTPVAPSDAVVTTVDLPGSVVGKATADQVNTDHVDGTADYAAITDWTGFENQIRAWGLDSANTFPNADQRGPCLSGTCRIWDWSLTNQDTMVRNVVQVPGGNDVLTHTWFAATEAACLEIPGAMWSGTACTSTLLRNAVELQRDGVGNDNLLCESQETCVYTPNIGAYQGHGELVSAGAFTDGVLTGITLLRHTDNGR